MRHIYGHVWKLIIVCGLVVCVGVLNAIAQEKQITPSFTEAEFNVLIQLLDLGVKQGGLSVVTSAAVIIQKLEEASKEATKEATKTTPEATSKTTPKEQETPQ